MHKYTKALAGLLVSLAAVLAIVRNISPSEVLRAATGLNWRLAFAGLVGVGIGYGIRSFRWWRMLRLRSSSISFTVAARVLMASFAANNVLPLRAGDALRAFAFRNILNVPAIFVITTLVLERLLDVLSILLIGLCFATNAANAFPHHMLRIAQALILMGVALLVFVLFFTKYINRCLFWLIRKLVKGCERRQKIEAVINNIFRLFESIRPSEAVHLLLLSVTAWSFEALLYLCVASGMHLHISVAWVCMALVAANLSALVPSSPGYVGTFHAAVLTILLLAGIERTSATAYAVVVHAMLWAAVTLSGSIAYLLLRSKPMPSVHDSTGEML